jgi:uncharacterized protein YjeT (DUF2065 family)
MNDLLVGLGLVLVIEGLLWATAPQLGLRLLVAAAQLPEPVLRTAGTVAVTVGVIVVWLVKG